MKRHMRAGRRMSMAMAPSQLGAFTRMTEPARLVTFHHDPAHSDTELDGLHDQLRELATCCEVSAGVPGLTIEV